MIAPSMPTYTFTEEEARTAHNEWGCNCGPSALAFALQVSLDTVRPLLSGFDAKKYTNPTMMKRALEIKGRRFSNVRPPSIDRMFDEHEFQGRLALVRIQWTGPWTAPDVRNQRWSYRQTHWITTWTERSVPLIFDCNGGIQDLNSWEQKIVPLLTGAIERADGGWYPTHVWRLARQ